MQWLLDYYAQFMQLSRSNPVVAGMVGLWGAGLITLLLSKLPKQIARTVSGFFLTKLTVDNNGHDGIVKQYDSLSRWLVERKGANLSRRYSLYSDDGSGFKAPSLSAGFGRHFFVYRKRLFWYTKICLDSSGSYQEKFRLEITGLTRNRALLDQMVEDFRHRPSRNGTLVMEWTGYEWGDSSTIPRRDLSTVILNRELKESILGSIESYTHNEAWYRTRNLPYKLTLVLEGPPGTGKSSLVRAIAGHLDRHVYRVNLATLKDSSLARMIRLLPKGVVLLIEDFDSSSAVNKRANMTTGNEFGIEVINEVPHAICEYGHYVLSDMHNSNEQWLKCVVDGVDKYAAPSELLEEMLAALKEWQVPSAPGNAPPPPKELPGGLSLSALLNALDGVVPLDDVLVFMTTNALADIDPALLRKGRVDKIFHIPLLKDPEIKEYVKVMCPNVQVPDASQFKAIAGCDLQALYLDNKWDEPAFVASIPTQTCEV